MVHLYPDYPLPLHEDEKRPTVRKCSGNIWLGFVFFLMLCTMITWECVHRNISHGNSSKTRPVEELLGGGVFGPCADNQIEPEKPLIGTGNGGPAVTTLVDTPNQITVTNGAGSITISAPQDVRSAPTNGQIVIGTANGPRRVRDVFLNDDGGTLPTIIDHYRPSRDGQNIGTTDDVTFGGCKRCK